MSEKERVNEGVKTNMTQFMEGMNKLFVYISVIQLVVLGAGD